MKKPIKSKLVILDAHALIHRAYHALPSFTSPSGEPTGAVYGVASILLRLIKELNPTHIVAAFDMEQPTFRHIAYKEYKATRKKTDDELISQFSKTKELFSAFHVPILEAPGFEADDIIGTLVSKLRDKDLQIIVASGDMDTMQLVEGSRVQVYTLRKKLDETILYDEKKVIERFGFKPKLLPDYKGLKGDPSDNIIGVRGVGDKMATQLIQEYGTIENIYKALKSKTQKPKWLKERIEKILKENEEEALFSKELALIRDDAPVSFNLEDFTYAALPTSDVGSFFRKMHFPSLIARLKSYGGGGEAEHSNLRDFDVKEISDFRKSVMGARRIGLVPEPESRIILVFPDDDGPWKVKQEDIKTVLSFVRENKVIISHNSKELHKFFIQAGCARPIIAFDTLLASWMLDTGDSSFDLDGIYKKEGIGGNDFFGLSDRLRKRLNEEELLDTYERVELPLTRVLAYMEGIGIMLDLDVLSKLKERLEGEVLKIEKEVHKTVGEEFNLQSPKQLQRILFEKLGISKKGIKRTPTKEFSTSFSELVKLRDEHPCVDKIIQHRELAKLLTTYVAALPGYAGRDQRVHTTFLQTGTVTGRLASRDPNLQNIPVRSETGREIRKAFVAQGGFVLYSFDYSQVELRIASALSSDEKMTQAFRLGKDIHTITAAEVFNIPEPEVNKDQRRKAKAINFGILYGMGARALAGSISSTVADAELYLAEYYRDFSGIREYRERVIDEARRTGFVRTMSGRKRYLPNIRSPFPHIRNEAERMAVNATIQGTAADIIKQAMIKIVDSLHLIKNADIRMLLQVHDELLFEVREPPDSNIIGEIRDIMEQAAGIDVPIVVDVKRGNNWQDMEIINM